MLTKIDAKKLIINCIESLVRSGTIEMQSDIDDGTVLLGRDANFDSLGFITLITELEDRLEKVVGNEIYIVLDEIEEFNIDNPYLTVEALSKYIETLSHKMC